MVTHRILIPYAQRKAIKQVTKFAEMYGGVDKLAELVAAERKENDRRSTVPQRERRKLRYTYTFLKHRLRILFILPDAGHSICASAIAAGATRRY